MEHTSKYLKYEQEKYFKVAGDNILFIFFLKIENFNSSVTKYIFFSFQESDQAFYFALLFLHINNSQFEFHFSKIWHSYGTFTFSAKLFLF